MIEFAKILCPTDFSQASKKALRIAQGLAGKFSSELLVLNVVDPIPNIAAKVIPGTSETSYPSPVTGQLKDFNPDDYLKKIMQESKEKLEAEVKGNRVKVHKMVINGNPPDAIIKAAQDQKADLIVMGTRGQTGIPRVVLGSVAEKVVRLSPVPVLTVGYLIEETKKEAS